MEVIYIGKPGWYGLRIEGCFPATTIVERLEPTTTVGAERNVAFLSESELEALANGNIRLAEIKFNSKIFVKEVKNSELL